MAALEEDKLTPYATVAVGLCAAALNFAGLTELAIAADYPHWLAWCYPVCVDAYCLTASSVWLQGVQAARVRRWARFSSLAALMLSMGAGGLRAFTDLGHLPVWAKFVVSMLPALMLGLAVHLLVLVRSGHGHEEATDVDKAFDDRPRHMATVVATATAAATVETPAAMATSRQRGKVVEARAFFMAEIGPSDDRPATELGALLAKRFDVHESTGRQWVATFRRELSGGAGIPALTGVRRESEHV